MNALQEVIAKRDAVFEIVTRHSAGRSRLFGSVARREEKPGNDIDILIDALFGCSLLNIVVMEEELGLLFGRGVDIRTLAGLHPGMRDTVLFRTIDLAAEP